MQNSNDIWTKKRTTVVAADNARFMSQVYTWMTFGICTSGAVAYGFSQNAELMQTLLTNRVLFWILIGAQLGAVFVLAGAMNRLNAVAAATIYLAYAALTGITFSTIFLVYTTDSIASAFTLTAFSFAGLSAFGFITNRDLGPVGSFCMMGLWGMIGFAVVSWFFPSMLGSVSQQVFSACGVVVFAGLTAYDTQKIKAMNLTVAGTEEARKGAIYGALTLYLDFINLFLSILRLVGDRRR